MAVAIKEWFDGLFVAGHASEWIAGLTGAGGAMFGSVVTVVWTEFFNRRTRKRDQRSRNAAGAFAAFQRLNQIYSSMLTAKRHLDAGIAEAKKSDWPHVCAVVQPMNRLTGPVEFPVDELWTLTQVGGHALINKVSSLDHAYNSMSDMLDVYRVRRDEVWTKFTPTRMEGAVGSIEMTPAEYKVIQPRFVELDSMVLQLSPLIDRLVVDALEAVRLLVQARGRPLGKTFSVKFPSADGTEVVIRAQDAPAHGRLARLKARLTHKKPSAADSTSG